MQNKIEKSALSNVTYFSPSIEDFYQVDKTKKINLPLYSANVKAGFPSPADDFIEKKLDLNEYLISHPSATFFVRVKGDSMINAGIYSGDILIVDRSLEAKDSKIIIACLNNEFTVKRMRLIKDKIYLFAENPLYKPIEIKESMEFEVWGVVTSVIHSV